METEKIISSEPTDRDFTVKVASSEGVTQELTLEEAKRRIQSLEISLKQANEEVSRARDLMASKDELLQKFRAFYGQVKGTVNVEPSSEIADFIAAEDRREELEKQFK